MSDLDLCHQFAEIGRRQGFNEGIYVGQRFLILRQLTRQIGALPEETESRIHTLSLRQVENLGEALLDFDAIADLEAWFDALE